MNQLLVIHMPVHLCFHLWILLIIFLSSWIVSSTSWFVMLWVQLIFSVFNQIKKKTYNAPCVASESEARISVYADRSFPYTAVNSSVFKRRLKVDSYSDDLQLSDKLFQTDGVLMLKAFIQIHISNASNFFWGFCVMVHVSAPCNATPHTGSAGFRVVEAPGRPRVATRNYD